MVYGLSRADKGQGKGNKTLRRANGKLMTQGQLLANCKPLIPLTNSLKETTNRRVPNPIVRIGSSCLIGYLCLCILNLIAPWTITC